MSEEKKSPARMWHERQVAPKLKALAEKCEKRGLSMVAVVDIEGGRRGVTQTLTPSVSLATAMVALAVQHGTNVDAYVQAVADLVRDNFVPHQSAVLAAVGVDQDPLKRFDPQRTVGPSEPLPPAEAQPVH